ncbi:preprotein translocase subunit SecA [Paramaledivibacter caminithermalis]|uniref:Protein translocase subunit SecA n=1 Tax=Paramaledivibacter caminithermalis (strain DSM 15212 / CIP 107654 / DViRD3) TaxID=1121301 RepID=A0A1M6L822_PARC5|nr:preprotein translocase subunit SecA [Paramaledivibacter caminithermalis]SHJ67314.1 protein translocase subunit secA [Paramaledivibacter caminithermalis DSM 15212]
MSLLEKIFGSFNDREVKRLMKTVDEIEALEPDMQALSNEELRGKTDYFKDKLKNGASLDDILPEAFAVVREAAVRTLGMRHYRVQLLGGIVLHQGRIAEMKTGEGKTLVATLPVYLNALAGKGVHVVTVNDYLASRDKEWMGKIYQFLGLTASCIVHGLSTEERREAYNADITYGTNNEFGFDYLRDNMVIYKEERVQRELNYAIVDEVDSILIDEARTPLIISGAGNKSTHLYATADSFIRTLKKDVDYTIDEKASSVVLTDESGIPKAEKFFGIENLADPKNMQISHHINQALKAHTLMKKDINYVIKDGEIVIVDEFTGRLMFGRRYSDGLHQAIEAKEGLEVRRESQTLATITLQNYFRMYNKLSGMTGTAKTEEDEFKHIYGMDVVVIPTNKPVIRKDLPDSVYRSLEGKFKSVIREIEERHKTGQPILVGTISIETSEFLSNLLRKRGIKHEVLNAKQHEREAEIVAQAGRFGAVTIATNMAGRGTDIVLGGNAEYTAKNELKKKGYDDYVISMVTSLTDTDDEQVLEARKLYKSLYKDIKKITDREAEKVREAGGLHILGTERHESRRIDNQLRGRSGRQGDPGSSQFFISLEDDLMRLFGSEKIQGIVDKLGMEDDEPIEAKILSKSIETAQKRVEGRNFSIRKHVLQYDDVMNKQREIIYNERKRVLEGENLREHILGMLEQIVDDSIELYTAEANYPEEWDLQGLEDYLHIMFLPKGSLQFEDIEKLTKEELRERILSIAKDIYDKKEKEITKERMREIERVILLKVVDTKWIDHIDAMDQLKQGIGLRAIGNEDPVRAYQMEGFDMFNQMTRSIREDTVRHILNVTVETEAKREKVARITDTFGGDGVANRKPKTVVRKEKKVGRNDPCPCGSGKKYKKCCGKNV